jgi:hypothetical protein
MIHTTFEGVTSKSVLGSFPHVHKFHMSMCEVWRSCKTGFCKAPHGFFMGRLRNAGQYVACRQSGHFVLTQVRGLSCHNDIRFPPWISIRDCISPRHVSLVPMPLRHGDIACFTVSIYLLLWKRCSLLGSTSVSYLRGFRFRSLPGPGFFLVSMNPASKCLNGTTNYHTTASFQIPSSSFINHIISRCILLAADSVVTWTINTVTCMSDCRRGFDW